MCAAVRAAAGCVVLWVGYWVLGLGRRGGGSGGHIDLAPICRCSSDVVLGTVLKVLICRIFYRKYRNKISKFLMYRSERVFAPPSPKLPVCMLDDVNETLRRIEVDFVFRLSISCLPGIFFLLYQVDRFFRLWISYDRFVFSFVKIRSILLFIYRYTVSNSISRSISITAAVVLIDAFA